LANLLAPSATQLKSIDRHNITRSETKNLQSTETGNYSVSDLFAGDSQMTVRRIPPSDSPLLITAPPDQAEYAGSSWHLTTIYSSAAKTARGKPVIPDQKGRVHMSNLSLFRNFGCLSSLTKFLPPLLLWFFFALIVINLPITAEAAPSAIGSLSFFALNTNGFVHPMKIDSTNRVIAHRNPDIIAITETKTNSPRSPKMSYDNYQFFEERGIPVSGHHLYKWGVVLGVKKGITVSQRVNITHPALIGRLVAVDIVIPLDTGDGFVHHVIAAYAPWDVTDTAETAVYWTEATKLCLASPNSWTLLGDLNATVFQNERKTGGSDARKHFTNFLRLSKGTDLWSNNPERSRFTDWTCKPRLTTDGGSIIDRIVMSMGCFLDSEIFVADTHLDFVPMTDHRAIVGRIILKSPYAHSARCTHNTPTPVLNKPRIKFPDSTSKHLFQLFHDKTDSKIRDAGLHDFAVTDDLLRLRLIVRSTTVV
jgi:hypothetical protein